LKQIPEYTLDQLDQMGAENVWVVGGEGVVPPAQVQQLESEGYNVERIAGDDRFLTNAEVIEAGGAAKDGLGIVATGFDFPDALGGGPLTYQGHPVGLSTEDNIKQAVIDALKGAGVDEVLILGGEAVVGSEVAAKLEANGIEVRERLAGANRSGTAAEVAEYAVAELGFSDEGVNVASGYTEGYGADALAGGPLTGQQDRPMLITRNVDNPGAETLAYLEDYCETLTDGIIFGQTGAVSAAAEDEMNEAATCEAAGGVSTLPELVSASIVKTVPTNQSNSTNPAGTYVQYNFDERVLSTDFADFKVYRASGALADSGDAATISADGMSVVVRFNALTNDTPNTVNSDDVADLTVATVVPGAVTDQQGETNPEGDAAIGTAVAPGGGTATTAGVTNAPDLTGVSGFREAANSTTANPVTIVDFTFDEAAFLTGVAADFQLIPVNGGTPEEGDTVSTSTTEPGGGTVPGGNGTTVISVAFNGDLNQADYARGVVNAGTVSDAATGGNDNPLQAADVANGGNTTDPDLVSVEFRPNATQGSTAVDQVIYTFDQNVASLGALTQFQVYKTDGSEENADGVTQPGTPINPTNPRQVAVNFADGALTNASGANVLPGAVVGTSGSNEADEVGQASTSGSTTGQTPGRTAAPDLTDVTIARATSDIFGNEGEYQATYTFDEDAVVLDETKFYLYLANGTRLVAATCDEGTAETTDNTVVCSDYDVATPGGTEATSAQIGSAVLGTVGADAVANQQNADTSTTATAGSERNPEGAEPTTGGTGTPAA